MLVTIVTVLSVLLAAVICAAVDAFAGLMWLWLLPLSFLGLWLVLALLSFLFLWAVCATVDMHIMPEKDDPFFRFLLNLYAEAIVTVLLMRVHKRGLEQVPKDGRFLLVCNHLNNIDPITLIAFFQQSQLSFISKKENDSMLIVGPLMRKTMCQPLDRENDRAALKTILRCISLVKEDEVSIAVFPEGYTSRDQKLHKFRNGAFKIAQKANVPIVVCTLQNTHTVFRNAMHLKPTDVELHLVGVIPAEELKGVTAVDIGNRVYDMMLSDLPESFRPEEETEN